MLFVAYNVDAEGVAEKRAELLPAHREFMTSLGARVLWGGPLLGDDGEAKLGGMYVFHADTAEEAREITQRDPLVIGGVYRSCSTTAWRWQSGPEVLNKTTI